MKKISFALSVLTVLGAVGCTNDSDDTNNGDIQEELCGSEVCTDDRVCENDVCVLHVSKNGDCSAENSVCDEGKCIKGICQKEVKEPRVGDKCSTDTDCGKYVCVMSSCAAEKVAVGGSCKANDDCSSAKCEADICIQTVGLGDSCDESSLCAAPYWCGQENKCIELPGAGEYCDIEHGCVEGMSCEYNQCYVFGLTNGDDCDEFHLCDFEWFCSADSKCIRYVYENDDCNEFNICNEGNVCFGGKCMKTLGECQSDDDCKTDSYCCTEENCEIKNICLPYGEGPRGNIDEACTYKTVPGMFDADVQCEWAKPAADDPYPGHFNVLTTPIVVNTPHDSGSANEIIFVTYNCQDGGSDSSSGTNINCNGVIRILNGETCKLHENIFDDLNHVIGASNLAAADVDNDGFVEIFAGRGSAQNTGSGATGGYGIVAFHWDDTQKKYITWWNSKEHGTTMGAGGPAIHDINNDGIPEIISNNGETFSSIDGSRLNPGQAIGDLQYTTVADLDGDGLVEAIGNQKTYYWDVVTSKWVDKALANRSTPWHHAFADFGTDNGDGTFDVTKLDGVAEVIGCGSGIVNITSLQGTTVLNMGGMNGGGPCTVGDFDGDSYPEVATAFGDYYRIFDPRCKAGVDGCIADNILWQNTSQDFSSASTGSSLFDFDGDGIMEAVYADECFTRVYDGPTGNVLFSSHHTSCTWYEYPIIVDVDNDDSAEIIVGSNSNCSVKCTNAQTFTGPDNRVYAIDPIHHGLRCEKDADCYSGSCKSNYCRCTEHTQCNTKTNEDGSPMYENGCLTALTEAEQADGMVCRAIHPQVQQLTGVRVLRDRLDRWTSSRNIWNQHIYTITNINDNQTIPKTSDWLQNFSLSATFNNFRQNVQGKVGANRAPDITGRFTNGDACNITDGKISLGAEICNRGTKMVASLMPATFYLIGDDNSRTPLCVSYTSENVPVGGCMRVTCNIDDASLVIGKQIVMVANDDGNGGRTTVECNDKNNEDYTIVSECPIN